MTDLTQKIHKNTSINSMYLILCYICFTCGPGSSVGIAIDYGLVGPGIEIK
jgi:hypothetical protein